MKRIFCSLLLSCMLTQGALAGHFYNIDSTDDLCDGSPLNFQHHLGFSDDRQATLINPRLAVTVTHGTVFKGQEQEYPSTISFYGKKYPIVRAMEHPEVNTNRTACDLTLFVLGEEVVHPDGGPVCGPIAVIDDARPMPDTTQNWYAHSLSRSPNLKLNSFYPPFKNTDFSTIYGKTKLDESLFGKKKWDRSYIRVSRDHISSDPTMMVPIGGDSGSIMYVRLQTGGFASLGVLARSSGEGTAEEFRGGDYTSLSRQIEWIKQMEGSLIDRGILPSTLQRLTTVSQDQWQLTPDSFELPKVSRTFDPAAYLALNPDVRDAFQQDAFSVALEKARTHHDTRAALEGRRTFLSQAVGAAAFDPMVYLALNYDLQDVFGKGTLAQALAQATHHHQTCGLREGRPYNLVNVRHDKTKLTLPENFIPKTYLHLNPDVETEANRLGVDPHAFAIEHYTKYGFKEKNRRYMLKLPRDFSELMYLFLNKDLQQAFGPLWSFYYKSWTHYVSLGFLEKGRSYHYNQPAVYAGKDGVFVMPNDFDPMLYLALHGDVFWGILEKNMGCNLNETLVLARAHYETQGGPIEGRRYR